MAQFRSTTVKKITTPPPYVTVFITGDQKLLIDGKLSEFDNLFYIEGEECQITEAGHRLFMGNINRPLVAGTTYIITPTGVMTQSEHLDKVDRGFIKAV